MSESKHSEAEMIGALKYLQAARKTEDTLYLHHGTPVTGGNSQQMRVGLHLESAQI